MPAFIGGVLFANDGAMLVNPVTPTGQTYNNTFRTDAVGCVFIDAATTPSASNTVFYAGMGFSRTTGALYCTETAVGATTTVYGGIARNGLGQVHVTFTKPSTVIFQNGFALSNTGQLYVAGPIAAPTAWYRYGLGITSAAALVSAWADQSGNANTLVQATEANKPTLQSDGSILFDGVNDFLQVAFTLDQPCTHYLLARQVTSTASDRFFDGVTAVAELGQGGAAPNISINAGATVATNGNLAMNTYGAVAVVFNGASSSILVNKTTETTGDAGANNPAGLTLCALNNGANNFGNMQYKEHIVYAAAHDATQRARVINYLNGIGALNL